MKDSNVPALTHCSRIRKDGGLFTSLTVMVNVRVLLCGGVPLSVTRTVIGNGRGGTSPSSSLGRHLNKPLPSIVAPVGAPGSRLKVSPCAGTLVSRALIKMLMRASSLVVIDVIGSMIGGAFGMNRVPGDEPAATQFVGSFP